MIKKALTCATAIAASAILLSANVAQAARCRWLHRLRAAAAMAEDLPSPYSRPTYAWDSGRRSSAASSGRLLAPVLAIAR
jgi:hypothetical protein